MCVYEKQTRVYLASVLRPGVLGPKDEPEETQEEERSVKTSPFGKRVKVHSPI